MSGKHGSWIRVNQRMREGSLRTRLAYLPSAQVACGVLKVQHIANDNWDKESYARKPVPAAAGQQGRR